MSVVEIGLRKALTDKEYDYILHNPYKEGLTQEESARERQEGLGSEFFVTGTNAITMKGELVNVDGYGNRVSAMVMGPERVIIVAGRNKIVKDLEGAVDRIRTVAAPKNAMRLHRETPCVHTGRCMDCSSPERICNVTMILHKSRVKGRISIIIVDDELGF